MRFRNRPIATGLVALATLAACGNTPGSSGNGNAGAMGGSTGSGGSSGSGAGSAAGASAGASSGSVAGAGTGSGSAGAAGAATGAAGSAGSGGSAGAHDSGTSGGTQGPAEDASEGDTGRAGESDATLADAASRTGEDASLSPSDAATAVSTDGAIPAPSSFHCVNWADQRDNFVNGLLQLSGLDSSTDTYATVQAKSGAILSGFETTLGADAIRVPINEPTVSGTWWSSYKGLIDTAVAKGMKVIIAYWAYQNGKPASTSAFTSMWQTVVDAYASNNLVFFDIHNEPYGFNTADWISFAAAWIANFPQVPKSRIIVAGSGYDQNVTAVAGDSRFDGCLFSLHVYTFFSTNVTTVSGWESLISSSLGQYAPRTIVTEWGIAMTTGVNYNADGTGTTDQAYMGGTPDEIRTLGIGSCYWPGLRIGDSWSITTLNGTGASATLSVTNASGLDRIHYAWGL
jgi:endoglucanase